MFRRDLLPLYTRQECADYENKFTDILINIWGLVKALRYKSVGPGIDSKR